MILQDIEQGLLGLLRPLVQTAQNPDGCLKHLDIYSGQAQELEQLSILMPFCLISYAGGPAKPVNLAAGLYEHSPVYHVIVGLRVYHGSRQAAHGYAGDPGAYDIFEQIIARLSGQRMGLEIKGLEWQGTELIDWEGDLAIFAMNFGTIARAHV
ncbi:MAG: hypothetical protein A2V67_04860 [Deltaproteobacteria bacterium RBG_13_61_14]|nr:MAG: hypothetical protein A2V67_04860 [Deltaproteobacteria bacterium RBG_13_61_14]